MNKQFIVIVGNPMRGEPAFFYGPFASYNEAANFVDGEVGSAETVITSLTAPPEPIYKTVTEDELLESLKSYDMSDYIGQH
jgi:hypothetical protein